METVSGSTGFRHLATPVRFLKGVGPKRADLLVRLGLKTARDIVFFFPREYQDMSELRSIERIEEGQSVSVCGVVDDIEVRATGVGRTVLGVLIRQGTHFLRAVWFNQPYMQAKFAVGTRVFLSGTPKREGVRWAMVHPRVEVLGKDEDPPAGRIVPSYSLTEGISQTQMRRIVRSVAGEFSGYVDEVFPDNFRHRYSLAGVHDALAEIHAPSDRRSLAYARRRFIFQELLVMQLALAIRRANWRATAAASLPLTAKIDARIRRLFPFPLTADQEQATREICADMERDQAMNRLIQGDVGSGKTVVAQYAMLVAVANNYQAVLMAPTEVLARQHAKTFAKSLKHSRARIGLLTGTMSTAERRNTTEAVASGEINLLIGTHAVLSNDVRFNKLGLVVIDEQHKFGVQQRARLREAGLNPHYMVMTATPIPRTISMTQFGDLDVSTLRQGPPGRQQVHTYIGTLDQRKKWWAFFRKKLREGRQAYVVTPLVEESSTLLLASAEEALERLTNSELSEFRLDLVHGRQPPHEKEAAMESFRRGETQVLVATSVVEVGVDVANATLMTIESGERFGLAQLHQLRGRISRGQHPGYLCVFANSPNPEAARRLEAFQATTDGFELAERDFAMRGPGDLFGLRQHGMPPLRVADLQRDGEVLQEARTAAQQMISEDPNLSAPGLERLQRMVRIRYGKALDLGDVG